MLGGLLDVLDRDQADAVIGVIDHDQLFDAVLMQQLLGFVLRHAALDGDQLVLGHQLGDRLIEMGCKTHVAVGQDADQLALAGRAIVIGWPIDHRHAGDAEIGHQFQRVFQRLATAQCVTGLRTMPLS